MEQEGWACNIEGRKGARQCNTSSEEAIGILIGVTDDGGCRSRLEAGFTTIRENISIIGWASISREGRN